MTGVGLLQRLRDLDDRVLPPLSRREGLERLAVVMHVIGVSAAVAGKTPVALFALGLAMPAGIAAALDRRRQRRASA